MILAKARFLSAIIFFEKITSLKIGKYLSFYLLKCFIFGKMSHLAIITSDNYMQKEPFSNVLQNKIKCLNKNSTME